MIFVKEELKIVKGDDDGIIITDEKKDACYIYYSELEEVIKKLQEILHESR